VSDSINFFYENRVCPECGGHQKNCEHFWAGHVVGEKFGRMNERERIIKLLEDYAFNNGPSGGILFAVALIKGENK
jgi:hypothetical protein